MTIQQIVNIAKLSQTYCLLDITKKGLYGGGVELQMPLKIYNIRKDVEWELNQENPVDEVKAIGYVTITDVGNDGDSISIYADDPILGLTLLVLYVNRTPSDTPAQCAVQIVNTWNTYYRGTGYNLSAVGDDVVVTARQGLGATINGGNNLQIVITNVPIHKRISAENGNKIITENSNNLITNQTY